jgi:MYXO-CTERM domain-containing protein
LSVHDASPVVATLLERQPEHMWWLLLVALHSQSRGAVFMTQSDEGVAVRIELARADGPELCGTIPTTDEEWTRCGQRAQLLTLRVGQRPCQLSPVVTSLVAADIHLMLTAHCPAATGDAQLDWGLFAGTELQHIAVLEVSHFDGHIDRTLLSRQANRFEFELKPTANPSNAWIAAAALTLALLAMVLAWRRRSR